jgi:molybdopterin synthase catalytic subunit
MNDAVSMAGDGNASQFKDTVGSLLMDKIKDSVAIKKHEVAANFMNYIEDSQDEDI